MLPQLSMDPSSFGPDTDAELFPKLSGLIYYAIFFFFGSLYWDFDDHQGNLFRAWWLWLIVGIVIVYPAYMVLRGTGGTNLAEHRIWTSGLQAAYAWLLTIGAMGCFHRFCAKESRWMRYISDSSYWLYIAHLPLVILAQWWVSQWQIPAILKIMFICVTVTSVLLVVYQFGVRYTPIGTLLNGKRTPS